MDCLEPFAAVDIEPRLAPAPEVGDTREGRAAREPLDRTVTECPKWVISRQSDKPAPCPLYRQ